VVEVLVKICGLTREQDVDAAVEAGADMVGFVVVPSSPRGVDVARARDLARRAPEHVRSVAVFRDPDGVPPGVHDDFDLVQVYGLPASTERTILAFDRLPLPALPDGVPVLLDRPKGVPERDDDLREHWRRAAGVGGRVMLAGGLHPGNVADAVRCARPWAVDTARGVEAEPGVKDDALIRAFVRNAKEAA
jgi:phosphoribosylanthranilate isomerase